MLLRISCCTQELSPGRDIALRCPRPRNSGRNACAAERGADGAARHPYLFGSGVPCATFSGNSLVPLPARSSQGEEENQELSRCLIQQRYDQTPEAADA